MQLDNLGIDYIERRAGLIDAVTLADARRVAKRLLDGGLLVTVAGRPEGVASTEAIGEARRSPKPRQAPAGGTLSSSSIEALSATQSQDSAYAHLGALWRRRATPASRVVDRAVRATTDRAHRERDALLQSIETRAERSAPRASRAALDDALARSAEALDWLRARHADGSCRSCACRRRATISRRSARAAAGCARARATSSCSAPAARASAARRWPSSPATALPRRPAARRPHLHFMDNLDPDTFGALLARCRSRPHASSRSRNRAAPPRP